MSLLDVGKGHSIFWVDKGSADGLPVMILPPGPGVPHDPAAGTILDGLNCRIIQMDPRGCGRSEAVDDLAGNVTSALIEDIERVRIAAGVERWMIIGHLWGATLAIAYAQSFPEHCLGLVLASVYLGEDEEVDWFYGGAGTMVPEAWDGFLARFSDDERRDLPAACAAHLQSADPGIAIGTARALMRYDLALLEHRPDAVPIAFPADDYALRFLRVFTHYLANRFFLGTGALIGNISLIRHLPAAIVQGRFDIASGARPAWRLGQAWPEAELSIVDGGCGYRHEPVRAAIRAAIERVLDRISS